MASEKGRGAQVRLDGEARQKARGAEGTLLGNIREAKVLAAEGAHADGTTPDGSTATGIAADDEVLAPGGTVGLAAVSSVNGMAGAVTITPANIPGLSLTVGNLASAAGQEAGRIAAEQALADAIEAGIPGTGGGNVEAGTADLEAPLYEVATGKYKPRPTVDFTADIEPTVEIASATAITYALHHRRRIVQRAAGALTVAAADVPNGLSLEWFNETGSSHSMTFGAEITVRRDTGVTGTGQTVQIAPYSYLNIVVLKVGTALVARAIGGAGGVVAPPIDGSETRSITFNPLNPGSLQETGPGEGADWTATINTTGISSLTTVVVEGVPPYNWRGIPVTGPTAGAVTRTFRLIATSDFVKALDANDFNFSQDSGGVTILTADSGGGDGGVTDSTAVDAEYGEYLGTVQPLTKAGLLLRGQSNAVFYGGEAIWYTNEGMEALLGGTFGRYNTGLPGLDALDAWWLAPGFLTGPDRYTAVGGVPLWAPGDSDAFLVHQGGVAPSSWAAGAAGTALASFITNTMSQTDRDNCPGVFFFHTENDSARIGSADAETHAEAMRRSFALMRTAFGRSAASLPIFALHPIPYGTPGGTAAVNAAFHDLRSNPADNFHVVGQTADSDPGMRYGSPDYYHRDTADLVTFARRLAYGVGRVLNSKRGVGSREFPGHGPKILHVQAETATQSLLTIGHDRGTSLSLGTGASDGRGFVILDGATQREATSVSIASANAIRVTHPACTGSVAERALTYCMYGQQLGRGAGIYDNWATKPGVAAQMAFMPGPEWLINFPLRATLVPLAMSSTAYTP